MKLIKLILGFFVVFVVVQACNRTSDYTKSPPQTAVPAVASSIELIGGDERKKIVSAVTKELELERDKVEKISFYSAKGNNLLKSRLEAYISLPDGTLPLLRMKSVYFGDDWVFYESIKIMADDVVIYERDFNRSNIVRDNSAGSVWETADFIASEQEIQALRTVANSKSATIRFAGRDYRRDHEITGKERRDIKKILETYEKLNSDLVRKVEKTAA